MNNKSVSNIKCLSILYFLLLYPGYISAQNLVPNSSFEAFIDCPISVSEIPLPYTSFISLETWSRPTDGSSDYFNECATFAVSVPTNIFGHQYARTGSAYSGLFTAYGTVDYREYIQTQLLHPLETGHRYYVSYWISPSEFSYRPHDQMGVLFINDFISDGSTYGRLDLLPQIVSPENVIFYDTTLWSKVSGVFTAAGGEEWMIIGCFQETETLNFLIGDEEYLLGYYFVDDVCVLDLDDNPTVSSYTDTCVLLPVTLHGSTGSDAFLWSDNDTSATKTITEEGIYWVKSIDHNNCSYSVDTYNIRSESLIYIDLGNDTFLCENTILNLSAFDPEFTEYIWSNGSTESNITVHQEGVYYVTVKGECIVGTDTIIVEQTPPFNVKLQNDTILCLDQDLLLKPINPIQENVIYTWNTGQDSCCILVNTSGLYTLVLENICGEKKSDSVFVRFSGCEDCIRIPNAFSPNGDGLNDKFQVVSNCIFESFHLSIFNRWGERIFTSSDVQDIWDGTYADKECEAGVYYYYLEATPFIKSMNIIKRKGDITLLK